MGDEVIAKPKRNSKLKTRFGEELFVVPGIKGSMITVESKDKEKCFTRHRSWFKSKTWNEDDEYFSVRLNDYPTTEDHGDQDRIISSPEQATQPKTSSIQHQLIRTTQQLLVTIKTFENLKGSVFQDNTIKLAKVVWSTIQSRRWMLCSD